jgi:predicted lactoylglutathione lyase
MTTNAFIGSWSLVSSSFKKANEVLICLSQPDRKSVDELVSRAKAAGGTTYKDPQDYGFMYGHCFKDLDGHVWELMYMDMAAMPIMEPHTD